MSRRSKLDPLTTFIPAGTDLSRQRIISVAAKHDIVNKAHAAGQKNEPATTDTDLDETQRALVDESQGFIGSVTRLAGTEITERANEVRTVMPRPLETVLEQSNVRRDVAEVKDKFKDDLDLALADRQRALRDLRAFEERNGLEPLSAIYKDDKAMFFAVLLALMLSESVGNAYFLQDMQSSGFLGAMLLAVSVGIANVLMGLGCGFLGLRLIIHIRWGLRLLGMLFAGVFAVAAVALSLALAGLREAITYNADAHIDFAIILSPTRWFAYTSIPPFVLFVVGVIIFIVSAMKARGGSLGVVAPYWHHDVMDRRFRKADLAYEDAKANFKDALANAYDGGRAKLKGRLDDEETHLTEILSLIHEGQDLERVLSDSIDAEIGRLHIWLRMYRDHNRTVRTTPAPSYFDTYPEFADWRTARLDLRALRQLAEDADKVLGENRAKLAALQDKLLQEQTAAIEAMATVLGAVERRASMLVEKDDAAARPRAA